MPHTDSKRVSNKKPALKQLRFIPNTCKNWYSNKQNVTKNALVSHFYSAFVFGSLTNKLKTKKETVLETAAT